MIDDVTMNCVGVLECCSVLISHTELSLLILYSDLSYLYHSVVANHFIVSVVPV